MNIASILFAVLGLSFLIFIHELGHYIVAKRAGMKIEVFSIGMGKPIFSWMQNGVKWQICYLIFGGYVKIAGMEGENGKEPYQIKEGFYSKKPIYRLAVAIAGPFVNISFALLVFFGIYLCGGQKKPFSQYTHIIGKVDTNSSIYEEGIRAGDKILSLDGKPYTGFKDIIIQGMLKGKHSVDVVFEKQNKDIVNIKAAFYTPENSDPSLMVPNEWKSMGVLSSASYVVSGGYIDGKKEFAPLGNTSFQKGDRIVYVDGNSIYSVSQLSEIINRDIALVTVDRNGKHLHLQVPRVVLGDLKLSKEQKDAFIDYKRQMQLEGPLASTYFIPYFVSDGLYVTQELAFIESEEKVNESCLKKGDKIIAVAGIKVHHAEDFYKAIASRKCLVMVSNEEIDQVLWKNGDTAFLSGLNNELIAQMEQSIGDGEIKKLGTFRFLEPTEPVSFKHYLEKASPDSLEKMTLSSDKESTAKLFEKKTLFSGVIIKDENIIYNPGPFAQAKDVFVDIIFSLKGLFSGAISPKHMSGPVGMVKIVHDGSKSSALTGMYWLGMISLNLGFMNLLPIPVLDGGHICFTMVEVITKKRIRAKTMQKMVLPFVALIIIFFAYVTFYDLIKVFS
jgi:regulator of sigma E protease